MIFNKCKIFVIGDIIVDTYYKGSVERISPEAPVPVVNINNMSSTLGGASNVANNISHLGAQTTVVGLVGDDKNKSMLIELCEKNNIENILIDTKHPTIAKTRILGNHQQIVRLDFEEKFIINSTIKNKIENILISEIENFDIIIISDYNKGFIDHDISLKIIKYANKHNKKVIVDPKKKDWKLYTNSYMITPNFKEFSELIGEDIENSDENIEKHGKKIVKEYNIDYILITRSEKGMSLISENSYKHFPTVARDVYDVSGAGDTVVATIATALASGLSVEESVQLSNKAAGVVVGKEGTSPIEYHELITKS